MYAVLSPVWACKIQKDKNNALFTFLTVSYGGCDGGRVQQLRWHRRAAPDVHTKIRLIIFFTAKGGEALYSEQKQDQELTVAQIMNSLLPNSDWNWRKWRKPLDHSGMTNQIPYDYTVEVRNIFKGLDLIKCLMNYGLRFRTLYRRQGSRPSPWKRNAKSKMTVEEALQIAV